MKLSNIDILVINLEEDKERLKGLYENLFFNGFDLGSVTRINAIKDDYGMIGCAASHVKALQLIKQRLKNQEIRNKKQFTLVLEDDFRFSVNRELFLEIMEKLKSTKFKWQVWQIYASRPKWIETETLKLENNKNIGVGLVLHALSTAAYLVKNDFLEKILYRFEVGLEVLKKNKPLYKDDEYFHWSHRDRFSVDNTWREYQGLGLFVGIDKEMGRLIPSYSHVQKKARNYEDGSLPHFLGMDKLIT